MLAVRGAGDGTRTRDVQLGKLAFYQLNYARQTLLTDRPREPQVGIEPTTARLRIECSTTELLWRIAMPWRGLEPRRLAAPPPQDGVSTNFTTRAGVVAPHARDANLTTCNATVPDRATDFRALERG